MSTEPFPYDVFLSHSAKDKPVVRDVAVRLKKDGLSKVAGWKYLTLLQ